MQRPDLEERIFGMIMGVAIGTVVGLLMRRRHRESPETNRFRPQAGEVVSSVES